MEAKCDEIAALLHAEISFPQIMKEVGTSLSTIYKIKNSLKDQVHVKVSQDHEESLQLSHPS